jgi:hypothetical protein
VPMCQCTLRAVRSALIRRGVHFTHCCAVRLKICQHGGLPNTFRWARCRTQNLTALRQRPRPQLSDGSLPTRI